MKKIGQFLAVFREKEASRAPSTDILYLEGAEPAERHAPAPQPMRARKFDFDDDAAYRLAAGTFDPCAMTEEENRRLADLLLDSDVINMRDYQILVTGPSRRCGTLADIRAPRNYLADWQDSLSRHMGRNDYTAIDTDSRALTILGKLMVARNAAA